MRTCTVTITGITPYSQSKQIDVDVHPRLEKESIDEWDKRLWREKATCNADGIVSIPGMALKMAIDEAIKRLNIGIPGRGKSTYTKFFVAGQIPLDNSLGFPTGVHKDDLEHIDIWANSDGVRGSGKRVKRRFPVLFTWSVDAQFAILDDIIPNAVFEKALTEAGKLIGIGRFRPEKGGGNGRFDVGTFHWEIT